MFKKHAYDAGGEFVMDGGLVVFSNDVDSEFLTQTTWRSGPLLRMARYSSLQGIGIAISLLKYRWCYESVHNYGTELEQNVYTIGGLICG